MSDAVILLHGLMMSRPAMLPLAAKLRRAGFATELFGYASLLRRPEQVAERLAMRLYALQPGPVHMVAHSLGGLIVLDTLLRYQQLPPGRVVCLGSPLAGSSAARHLQGQRLGFLSGRSGPLLRSGLPMLPEGRKIGMIAGGRSMGLGRWFGGGFDGVNDGTVAVWETRLPGLSGHRVLPVSHSGLLFSQAVAEHVTGFLREGHFPERRRAPR